MSVSFANAYIDRLFAEKDMPGLHHLISVMERDKALPEEFWLFSRILEWLGSVRSGIYQYYEGIPRDKFKEIGQTLDQFKLTDLAERYRYGMSVWNGPDKASDLDEWIYKNEDEVQNIVFQLISQRQDCLKQEN
jgi:hypothetical protein